MTGTTNTQVQRTPISRVVLYKHGVASFERRGVVNDTEQVNLSFRENEMNDVLKSLTIVDLDGGHISSVSYNNNLSFEKRKAEATFSLTQKHPSSQVSLIAQLAGCKVELYDKAREVTESGIIVRSSESTEKEEQSVCIYNTTTNSLQFVSLSNIGAIKFVDPSVQEEFNEALGLCRFNPSKEVRQVTIYASGEGERRLNISYTIQSPMWKISYRIILTEGENSTNSDENQKKEQSDTTCWLQGWAVIDNITDEPWKNVSLTLIAGQPHSVEYDLLHPHTKASALEAQQLQQQQQQQLQLQQQLPSLISNYAQPMQQMHQQVPQQRMSNRINLSQQIPQQVIPQSVPYSAETKTKELGDLFQYDIENPATIDAHQSALVPIIYQQIQAQRVALFNSTKHTKHPNSAVFITNNTNLTLEAGPVTVVEGTTFVGESEVDLCKPGQTAFIEYATEQSIDLWSTKKTLTIPRKVIFLDGQIRVYQKQHNITTYHIRNKADREIVVYIEHLFDKTCTLVNTPKPTNPKPVNNYIFRITATAKDTVLFEVTEERDDLETIQVAEGSGINGIKVDNWKARKFLTTETEQQLRNVVSINQVIAAKNSDIQQINNAIKNTNENQSRIRSNLQTISSNSDSEKQLRIRYINELTQDEETLKQQRSQISSLEAEIASLQSEAKSILLGISSEISI